MYIAHTCTCGCVISVVMFSGCLLCQVSWTNMGTRSPGIQVWTVQDGCSQTLLLLSQTGRDLWRSPSKWSLPLTHPHTPYMCNILFLLQPVKPQGVEQAPPTNDEYNIHLLVSVVQYNTLVLFVYVYDGQAWMYSSCMYSTCMCSVGTCIIPHLSNSLS